MSNKDVECRFCGVVTGIIYDVCKDCAGKDAAPNNLATIDADSALEF